MTDDTAGEDPCFAHLLIGGHPVDPQTARDVARFRSGERKRLLAMRRSLSSDDRYTRTQAIIDDLTREVDPALWRRIAVYWPIRGEPDLRPWMTAIHHAGACVLLPEVVDKESPLRFREWRPGDRMVRGIWNIPVPEAGEIGTPDLVISPLVGVDRAFFRLGNGGGYYDRTLALLDPRPRVIGVGFPGVMVPTIYPMPWDVGMDAVILGDGSLRVRDQGTSQERP